MPQIISVGEALVEIMRPGVGQPLDKPGDLNGPFASGAPAIFAVAAARLGFSVGFISGVGDDAFGRLLIARLEAEGVDLTHLQTVSGYTTGMAFVAYLAGGRREFVFHLRHSASGAIDPARLKADYFSGVKWLHISGSALALSDAGRSACARALELTQAAGGRLSFDPNFRPELMSVSEARQVQAPYLAAAGVLLPTAEEAHLLSSTKDDAVAGQRLLGDQDRIVVFKRGPAGCTIFSKAGRLEVPGFEVEEVDPTGAGDCFNAAFLYGLEAGWPLARVGRFANAAGALAVTKQGPMEGSATREQVEEAAAGGR